jgi:hypothetical protein
VSSYRITLVVLTLACGGCATTVPVQQVQLVGKAFQDLNAASAPLFDDMSIAERARGIRNAKTLAGQHPADNTAEPTALDPCPRISAVAAPGDVKVQDGFCIEHSGYYSELTDPPVTATFRRSLAAVESYTNVLLILAEGRNLEAAQAEVQGLSANVGGLLDMARPGAGVLLTGVTEALKPLLEIAAKNANAKELTRNVKRVAPDAKAVIRQLRLAAPEMFTTLTQQSLSTLTSLKTPPSAEIAKIEDKRISAYRIAVSNYVVLLGRYEELLDQLVDSYDAEGKVITLSGLLQRSTDLSAQADAWRRTYSALRMGL